MAPRYIIRLDDASEQMNTEKWMKICNILLDKKITPIIAAIPFNEDKQAALFCVYDGHGVYGELVSEFVMWKVQEYLLAAPERLYSDTEALLIQSFEEADRQLELSAVDSMVSGSTAVAVLALQNVLVRLSFCFHHADTLR